jgi:hypothetical protein
LYRYNRKTVFVNIGYTKILSTEQKRDWYNKKGGGFATSFFISHYN